MVNINEIISNYIVSNVEKEVLVKRIATIIETYEDVRDVLLNGIIVDVKIIDYVALMKYVSDKNKKYKVSNITVKPNFTELSISYSIKAKRYAKRQDETYWYNTTDEKKEGYFEVEVSKPDSFRCNIEDLNGIVEAVVL